MVSAAICQLLLVASQLFGLGTETHWGPSTTSKSFASVAGDAGSVLFADLELLCQGGRTLIELTLMGLNLGILGLAFAWAGFALCRRRSRRARVGTLALVCFAAGSGLVLSIIVAPSFTLAPVLLLSCTIVLLARALAVHVFVPFGAAVCAMLTSTWERGAQGASWRSWLLRD